MNSGSSSPRRNPLWLCSLAFLIACTLFAGTRLALEAARQRDLAAWDNERQLDRRFWSVSGENYETVMQKLAPGATPISKLTMGPRGYQVDLPAGDIDQKYEGWQLILTFYRHGGKDAETLSEMTVVPPANLPSEPTELWWAIERFRQTLLWLAAIGWAAGLVLIACVRGVRRRIALFCLGAALLCMLCAALDVHFGKERIVSPFKQIAGPMITGRHTQYRSRTALTNFAGWFDAGGVMALLALLIGARPARAISARACAQCGYDLTGNESGVCPECGHETAKALRQKRLAELTPAAERLSQIQA